MSAAKALLLVPNHPAFYPHVARHAIALRKRFDQVTVIAVFKPGDALPGIAGVTWLSCAEQLAQGVGGFLRLMRNVATLVRNNPADAVEAVDPPCLVPAALALLGRKTRLVYFSMELFPETAALVHRPWRRRAWKLLEWLAAKRAQAVLTVNRSVATCLATNLGRSDVGVVRSMPERMALTVRTSELKALCGLGPEAFLLVYHGHVEPGRGIELAVDCLRERTGLHLAVLGHGPLEDWVRERACTQTNIHALGALPYAQLMLLLSGADAGLCWSEPLSESYRLSLPGKLFELVQAGVPVLGSPMPEILAHVQTYGIGEVSPTLQRGDMLATLDRLVEKARCNAYAPMLGHARQELCWEKEQAHLLEAFA